MNSWFCYPPPIMGLWGRCTILHSLHTLWTPWNWTNSWTNSHHLWMARFWFYDLMWYRDQPKHDMTTAQSKLGQWLGIVHCNGTDMFQDFWIIKHSRCYTPGYKEACDYTTDPHFWSCTLSRSTTYTTFSIPFSSILLIAPLPFRFFQQSCHGFDVKTQLIRKAFFVPCGHLTDARISTTYSEIFSWDSVRLAFLGISQ